MRILKSNARDFVNTLEKLPVIGGLAAAAFEKLSEISPVFAGVIGGLLSTMINAIKTLFAAQRELMDATGATEATGQKLLDISIATADQYGIYGVGLEMAKKSAASIANSMGNIQIATDKSLVAATGLASTWGLTTDEAAEFSKTLTFASDVALKDMGKRTEGFTAGIVSMATKAGIAPSKVMKDLAKSSGVVYTYFRGNAVEAVKAAVSVAKLGLSMEKAASAADKLLDWDSSIEAELNASVLMGRSIDMSQARMKAFNGDLAGATEEIIKQAGGMEKFNSMNSLQKKAMADAAGMTVEDLTNAMKLQKENNALAAKGLDTEKLKKLTSEQTEEMLKGNNSEEVKNILLAHQRQTSADQLKDTWENLQLQIVKFMNENKKLIDDTIQGLISVVKWLLDAAKWLGEHKTLLYSILGAVTAISLAYQGIKIAKTVSEAASFGKELFGIGKAAKGMKDAVDIGTKSMDALKSSSDVAGGALNTSGAAMGNTGNSARSFGERLGSLGKGIGDFIHGVVDGLMRALASIGNGIGQFFEKLFTGLANGLSQLGRGQVFLGILALGLLAGVVWLAAKSFQEFSKVSWEDMGKAAVAIVVLAAAVFGLGALLSTGVGAAIFGVGVIGFLALGVALIPLAFAANLAAPALLALSNILGTLTIDKAVAAGILGISLGVLAIGFAALTGASILNGLASLFGLDVSSQIKKLISAFDNITDDKLKGMDLLSNFLNSFGKIDKDKITEVLDAVKSGFKDLPTISFNIDDSVITKLDKMASYSQPLQSVSNSVSMLGTSLRSLEIPDTLISQFKKLNEQISELTSNMLRMSVLAPMLSMSGWMSQLFGNVNNAVSSVVGGNPPNSTTSNNNDANTQRVIDKLDELKNTILNMEIKMDTVKVAEMISKTSNSRRPGHG